MAVQMKQVDPDNPEEGFEVDDGEEARDESPKPRSRDLVKERVLDIQSAAAERFGDGIATGAWYPDKITFKVRLSEHRVEYFSCRPDIGTNEALELIERVRNGGRVPQYIPPAQAQAGSRLGALGGPVVIKRVDGEVRRGRGRVEKAETWDSALLDRAKAIKIPKSVIRDGGDYREDERGKVYFLPLDHLVEFEEHDQEIEDNDEFWAWFHTARKGWNLQAKRTRTTWDDGYYTQKRDHYSSWWSDWTGGSWGWGNSGTGSELSRQLVAANRVVAKIVSVIAEGGKRFRVVFANDDRTTPDSSTDFNTLTVTVSPQALLDTSIPHDRAVRVTSGYSLHEASHVKYTGSIVDAILRPTPLQPIVVAGDLFNIVEDVRIEALTSAEYPGFASYFTDALNYIWSLQASNVPRKWGPDLGDKLNAIVSTVKWPTEYEPIARQDPDLEREFAWFRAWAERYRTERTAPRAAIIEALIHLREDPETAQQMDQAQQDQQQGAPDSTGSWMDDKSFEKALEALRENLAGGKPIKPCPSPQGKTEVKLTPDQAKEVQKLLDQEWQVEDPVVIPPDIPEIMVPRAQVLKPAETQESKNRYTKPGPLVKRLRDAFVFRKLALSVTDKLQRVGQLDEDELHRVLGNDFRVFERTTTPDEPDADVTLLVDMSGSMNGHKVTIARNLATVLIEVLRVKKGVRVRVRGFRSTYASVAVKPEDLDVVRKAGGKMGEVFGDPNKLSRPEAIVFRIWEPGDPLSRLGLISAGGANFDGPAIDYCLKELDATRRPGAQGLLIVLSDGLPNEYGYSGLLARQHVRTIVDYWARRGLTTVQIAIDPTNLRPQEQAEMYRHWIGYESDARLPFQLTQLLAKTFGGQNQ